MRSKDGRSFIERARRTQFVESAIDALADTGYAATTILAVADRAEITKSVVLYHFHTKTELLEAVVEHVYAQAAPIVQAALDAASDDRARLGAYVRACTMFAWTHHREIRALAEVFANLRRADGTLRYGPAENAPMIEMVERLLRAGQQSGQFCQFDTRTMAHAIRAAIDRLADLVAADPDPATGAQHAEQLAALFDRATR